jgi:hypothetical protein
MACTWPYGKPPLHCAVAILLPSPPLLPRRSDPRRWRSRRKHTTSIRPPPLLRSSGAAAYAPKLPRAYRAEAPQERRLVGAAGFEPATLCSQSRCATGLRYAPPAPLVPISGATCDFANTTDCRPASDRARRFAGLRSVGPWRCAADYLCAPGFRHSCIAFQIFRNGKSAVP